MYQLYNGSCEELLWLIPDASVDSVVTDPPYAEVRRPYGRLTEDAWMDLMRNVVREVRRVLKPTGSAVFIIQPNSKHLGQMRLWVWRFLVWCGEEWNIVQDAYWWNPVVLPSSVSIQGRMMRPSLKYCVWLGSPECYRNQDAVLWEESERNKAMRLQSRALREMPSGRTMDNRRCGNSALERGGVTPFNVLPLANADSTHGGGAHGHGAATPLELCKWWVRYITPPGGTVLDPFVGSGTTLLAAHDEGRNGIGIERDTGYYEIAESRLNDIRAVPA